MTNVPHVSEILARLARTDPCIAELRRRYSECNEEGHIAPNAKDNRCMHCFMKLSYGDYKGNARDYNSKTEIERVMDYFAGLQILRGDEPTLKKILSRSSS